MTTPDELAELGLKGWLTVRFCECCLASDKPFVAVWTEHSHYVLCNDCMTATAKIYSSLQAGKEHE